MSDPVELVDPSHAVSGDRSRVSGWSGVRLPFEPRGGMLDYRDALRAALRQLRPRPDAGLVAAYLAPNHAFVDIENVALYNIGTGSYSHLTSTGLTCVRAESPDSRHHLRYHVGPLADPQPAATRLLARVEAALPLVPHTPTDWWAAIRPHVERRIGAAATHLGQFVVDLTLTGSWTGTRVAGVTKSMLDGLVSALHCHDGSNPDVLRPRLTAPGDPSKVWHMLCDSSTAVLGRRTLIRAHGSRLAWNPADHLCTAFRVRVQSGGTRGISAVVRAVPG